MLHLPLTGCWKRQRPETPTSTNKSPRKSLLSPTKGPGMGQPSRTKTLDNSVCSANTTTKGSGASPPDLSPAPTLFRGAQTSPGGLMAVLSQLYPITRGTVGSPNCLNKPYIYRMLHCLYCTIFFACLYRLVALISCVNLPLRLPMHVDPGYTTFLLQLTNFLRTVGINYNHKSDILCPWNSRLSRYIFLNLQKKRGEKNP